jgi:hypothetical protein
VGVKATRTLLSKNLEAYDRMLLKASMSFKNAGPTLSAYCI